MTVSFLKLKQLVEITCQGECFGKIADKAEQHFEWLVEHAPEWESIEPKMQSKQKSIFQLKAEDSLSIKYEQLARMVQEMEARNEP